MEQAETTETHKGFPEYHLADPADFDAARVIIEDPVTTTFTIDKLEINNTTSTILYKDDDGVPSRLYVTGPEQPCFGTSYSYDIGKPETMENVKGMQMCYQLTGLQDVANPLPHHQAFIDMIGGPAKSSKEVTGLYELVVANGREQADRETPLIPPNSVSSFVSAFNKKNRPDLACKVPYAHPNIKDTKTPDTKKPFRMYVKLKTKGKADKLRCQTRFYGPGDKEESAFKYLEVKGKITPVYLVDGIYWGSHGPQAPQGASLRLKLHEASIVPTDDLDSGSKTRFIGKNTAPPKEGDDDDVQFTKPPPPKSKNAKQEEDAGVEEEDFKGGDAPDPVKALRQAKAAATKGGKPPAPKAAVPKTTPKPVAKAVAKVAKPPAKPAPKAAAKPTPIPTKALVVKTTPKPVAKTTPKPVPKVVAPPSEEVDGDEEPVEEEEAPENLEEEIENN